MVESFEKRQRERHKREKQAEKRARRKDRAELKVARANGTAPPAVETSYPQDEQLPATGPRRQGPTP